MRNLMNDDRVKLLLLAELLRNPQKKGSFLTEKEQKIFNVCFCSISGLVILFLLIAFFFVGCSSEKAPHVPTGDALTWDEDYTGPIYTKPSQEQEQAITLTYYPDKTMNPLLSTDFTNRALFSLLYQGLFCVDRNYTVEPMLCSRYAMSEDMRTYTFYLENATFSDGSALTVQDVFACLQAANESAYYGGRFLHVADIRLSEDGGITVQMDTPYENLPLLLDIPIIKQSELEHDRPLGTGPYFMDTTSGSLRLRRRTDWWCSAEMTVRADLIPLIEAGSAAQIRDQFEFADLSLVCADPGSDRYADYRCDYELWDCENGIFLYLGCTASSSVFSVPEVRKALTHAIDRDSLVTEFYRGFARAATLPASPLSPYYAQPLAEKYGYDSVKFAQAINDAGLKDSTVIFLVNSDDSLRVRVARAIGQMLTDCGLNVQMEELSGSAYQFALKAWNYDLYLGQTKLSPNMDLTAFFSSYGELSWGGVNNAAAYALCQEALANRGNYYTLHQTVMENGLLCPVLFRSYSVYATRGLLTGLTPSRDNVFYYSIGKNMTQALISQ